MKEDISCAPHTLQQGLKFDCVEQLTQLHKHTPAWEIWGHAPTPKENLDTLGLLLRPFNDCKWQHQMFPDHTTMFGNKTTPRWHIAWV